MNNVHPVIRIGVVGLGMGRVHIQNFQRSSKAKVQALCDLDSALLARTAREL